MLPRLLLKHALRASPRLRPVPRSLASVGCSSARESPSAPEEEEEHGRVATALQRSLRVSVIGLPNAGKSTLVNQLLSSKVFAVSPKVHTTVRKALGVFTEGDSQILLLDTPGMVMYKYGRKLGLPRTFLTDPLRSLAEAELIVVITDASDLHSREALHPAILQALRGSHNTTPAVLAINKVDTVKHKQVLLEMAEALTGTVERRDKEQRLHYLQRRLRRQEKDKSRDRARTEIKSEISELQNSLERIIGNGTVTDHHQSSIWPYFKEVFMISALTGDGISSLKEFLVSSAKPHPWEYRTDEVSDQTPLALVEDIVREKLFLNLDKEIPYVVKQENVQWERDEDGTLVIYQNLTCKRHSQAVSL